MIGLGRRNPDDPPITLKGVDRLRWLILFVLAWLIGVYVFDLLSTNWRWAAGIVTGVVIVAVNVYARLRVAKTVETNRAFYFWLTLPVVTLIIPLGISLWRHFTSPERPTGAELIAPISAFVLKLVLPAALLWWVYLTLGRWRRRLADSVAEADENA